MARIYKRPGREGWSIDFWWKGKRYREFAGSVITKQDAEQFLAKRMREVQRTGIYDKPIEPVAFSDFAADFLKTDCQDKRSKDRDKGILELLKEQWKGLNLSDVTPKMIEDYKVKRMVLRKPATVSKEVQIIKRLFRRAMEWGKLRENPASTVKKPRVDNTRVRFLEPDEWKRLHKHLPEYLQVISTFARFTGARRGEILALTWNDVDMKRRRITFREAKTGRNQVIVMNETTKALLDLLPSSIDRSQRVFTLPSAEGNKPAAGLMKLRRDWAAACLAAKVTDFHFHDLRHQAATDLLTMGAGLNDARDFLRHKSATMTLRYAHLIEERRTWTARLLDFLEAHSEKGTQTGTNSKAGR